MGRRWVLQAALGVAVSFALAAQAHTTGTGLLVLTVSASTLQYRLTLVPAELPEAAARLLALAAEGDRASVERVTSELQRRVPARVCGEACRPGRATVETWRATDSRVTLDLTLSCPTAPSRLAIRDDWFDLFGEHYRTLPGSRRRRACTKPYSFPTHAR